MWNGDSGADTWCPAMEPMSQIMFYNHLATFGTIYKSAKGPQVGRFHNGMGPDVERGPLLRTHGVRPWNQCLKSCFIIIWQLLAPFTSQPRVHKWAGSTTGWVLMWNGDSGADTWCPAMEPMSQIMFYNHLATFGTIYKSAKGPQVGRFHNGMGPDVERGPLLRTHGVRPWNQCLKSCFIIIWQLLAPFKSQPRVHKWAGSTTGWVLMWNGDSGADTWCPAMEPMSQIMFYNHLATFGTIYKSAKGPQVGRFHNGMGPDVERGPLLRTHGVRPWNQCLKSCFIIIWQLLAPFTSQPRVHKWAGSTTGWVLMWNGDSGADTWCPAMEPMSQIMFYNHLATFGTIYKSAKGPQVGRFHNGMGPDVERGPLLRTHGVRPWNQCLKSCFIIIWQLLAPFTSQPRIHKWAGSTTGWVLMWNGDSGADTWCPAMEPMSQIMFYNHLATFGTIYKSAKGPQVGLFHNGMGPDVERGPLLRIHGVRP